MQLINNVLYILFIFKISDINKNVVTEIFVFFSYSKNINNFIVKLLLH